MRKVVVLCDFDGTVAEKDVGDLLFRRFGGPDAHAAVSEWERGEINSRECLERQAHATRATPEELRSFAHACRLDPYFRDFHDFARRRGIEVVVLSDGLDFYIERMLARHGCGSIEFYSNRLSIQGNTFRVEFPWYNLRDCTECGCCKTHHLYAYRRKALARFVSLPPSTLERRERLEQLRALEDGMRIDVALTRNVIFGGDTQEHLDKARALLARPSTQPIGTEHA